MRKDGQAPSHFVVPAQAGTHCRGTMPGQPPELMGPRLRGGDG